ncbi:MAG: hypothetical protein ABIO44_09145, partial [Saprospiraceae bacterium]
NLLANDDMHDLTKPNEFCVRYTMVDTKIDLTSTLQELQIGNAYGVSDPTRVNSMKLKSCLVDSLTKKVLFTEIADTINFIGKGGSIVKTILHDSTAQYTFNASDPYIRIESKKEDCSLYLNPIIRSQDGLIPLNLGKCHINWFATIIEKIKLCIFTFFLILLLYKIRYKWRRPKIIMNKEIFSP